MKSKIITVNEYDPLGGHSDLGTPVKKIVYYHESKEELFTRFILKLLKDNKDMYLNMFNDENKLVIERMASNYNTLIVILELFLRKARNDFSKWY